MLHCSRNGAVLTLTLADEPSRNSLSEAMLSQLQEQLALAEADLSLSVILFAAEGKVYSAGHNLKELTTHRTDADAGAGYFKAIFAQCSRLMEMIAGHRCVTIAQVHGLASAAGCQLVASCDLAFASPLAQFCTPGVSIGLFCATPMVALSRAVGPRFAKEMLLTGDNFDAEYALRIGLVNAVFAPEFLAERVMAVAQKIAGKSREAIGIGKPAFDVQRHMELKDAYSYCSDIMTKNMADPSAREGIAAFIEKRVPLWPRE